MSIRIKLTVYFSIIVATILIIFSFAIYYSYSIYRVSKFYMRLENKATSIARMFIETKEIDSVMLNVIYKKTINDLIGEKTIIFDENNKSIFENVRVEKFSEFTSDKIEQVRNHGVIHYQHDNDEIIGIVFKNNNKDYVVFESAYDFYGHNRQENLKIVLFIGVAISIIIIIVLGYFYANKTLSPISRIINQVNDISLSNINQRLSEGNKKDELALLSITFNKMLDRMEKAFELQKHFLSNASHELRTPLTSITGQIEVTLMNERSIDEYKELLSSLLEDSIKLNSLINSLLLLAHSNTDLTNFKFVKYRVDDLLFQCQADIYKRNNNYKIQIDFEQLFEDESKITTFCDTNLLKTAFMNIIENACKYSNENKVNILIKFNEKFIILNFSDNGIGIPSDDLKYIFEPFFKCSNNTNSKGFGIGLSLVKRIIDLHNGLIEINSVLNKGTNIIVSLSNNK